MQMAMKLGMLHWLLVYSNNNPGLTLIYFTAMSNLVSFVFVCENA